MNMYFRYEYAMIPNILRGDKKQNIQNKQASFYSLTVIRGQVGFFEALFILSLFIWKAELQWDREKQRIFHIQVHSPSSHNGCGLARQKPGAWSNSNLPHGTRDPGCLPRCVNRELGRKRSSHSLRARLVLQQLLNLRSHSASPIDLLSIYPSAKGWVLKSLSFT